MNTQSIYATGKRIAEYLKNYLENHQSYVPSCLSGEAFSVAIFSRYGILDEKMKEQLFELLTKEKAFDRDCPLELFRFALSDFQRKSGDNSFLTLINRHYSMSAYGTGSMFLRMIIRCQSGVITEFDWKEIIIKIKSIQHESGLICETKGERSFFNHCFLACLIWELFQFNKDPFFKDAFFKATNFIRHFIFPSGETLHIGRSQHHSLGQGYLLALLSFAYSLDKTPELLAEIKIVYEYLSTYERSSGCFPLVMNQATQQIPLSDNFMLDENCAGWSPQNNHYESLAVLAYYLHRASEALIEVEPQQWNEAKRDVITSYQDQNFLLVSLTRYLALIGRSGGDWNNEQSLPLIFFKKQFRTPCFGYESLQKTPYAEEQLSLPYHPKFCKSLRWRGFSFWVGNNLFHISLLGFLRRSFHFSESKITMTEFFISPFSGWRHMRSFFSTTQRIDSKSLRETGLTIKSSEVLQDCSEDLCSKGKLKTFWSAKASELSWEFD